MMNIWTTRRPRRYSLIGCILLFVATFIIVSEVLNPSSASSDDAANRPENCDQATLAQHYMRNLRYCSSVRVQG